MKKEFYKLIIVFLMIVFSSSLAFFLGREMALAEKKQQQTSFPKNEISEKSYLENPRLKTQEQKIENIAVGEKKEEVLLPASSSQEKVKSEDDMDRKKSEVLQYRKKLSEKEKIQKPSEEVKIEEIKNRLYFIKLDSYPNKDEVVERVAQLQIRFPQWKVFFKKTKTNIYEVYIGPFRNKSKTEKLIEELKVDSDFPQVSLTTKKH